MTWSVVRRITVLGAPVLFIADEDNTEVSIGQFDYPDGRRKVRIEIKAPKIFTAAAMAARAAESARALMTQLADGRGYAISVVRQRERGGIKNHDSMIVDVNGAEALALALPYFGQSVIDAWHAPAPPRRDLGQS